MRRLPLLIATFAVPAAAMAIVLGGWGSLLVGHAGGEAMSNAWVRWLVSRALGEGRLPFFHRGAVLGEDFWLYPVDLSTALPTALIQPVLGEPATTNLSVAVLLGFATWATGRAAEAVGAAPLAAAIVAAWLGLHPTWLGLAADGRVEALQLGWMALGVAWWWRLMREPTPRSAIKFGVGVGALALAGPNVALVFSAALFLPSMVGGLVQVARRRWQVVPSFALGAGLAAVTAGLVLGTMWSVESRAGARLATRPGSRRGW